jgi:hypothetical protein
MYGTTTGLSIIAEPTTVVDGIGTQWAIMVYGTRPDNGDIRSIRCYVSGTFAQAAAAVLAVGRSIDADARWFAR